ncbi:MAG: zinc ribbon domain-containing protein [Dehalococcoidales bacterium]|nr:zinc ribbon domain-containing protein [Dehalococcoidales bacterium]
MAELQSAKLYGVPQLDGRYSQVLDMWPLESEESNRLFPFYDNMKQGRWTTTKCKKCGYIHYPPVVTCTNCWSEDLEWVDIPKKAKVVSFTETMAGAPLGFDSPLIVAWLGFDKSHPLKHLFVRIINCAAGQLKAGDEVQFVTFEVPSIPIDVKKDVKVCDRVYYAFEPVKK